MEECTECLEELGYKTPCEGCPIKKLIEELDD
jgi:hypothetical protein